MPNGVSTLPSGRKRLTAKSKLPDVSLYPAVTIFWLVSWIATDRATSPLPAPR